ncbi:wall-associated receptor kinase 2-like [Papaver somniferum]|uniref:wall-associated receptor kinase 2-like n=1 Tax=Papaver somniferum TaxID=3469 RepID=UPI000E7025D6|nr:wall-associated receptor kinase 2-like [Papaver somniferum]
MSQHILLQLVIIISCWITIASSSSSFAQTKPGCQLKCGDVSIPYPFGIISSSGANCSMYGSHGSYGFSVNCNTTYNPPRPFLAGVTPGENQQMLVRMGNQLQTDIEEIEILSISESEIRLKTLQASSCYNKSGALLTPATANSIWYYFVWSPFTFSDTKNRVYGVGCATYASIVTYANDDQEKNYSTQCQSECVSRESEYNHAGSCTGSGCCEMTFPKGQKSFQGIVSTTLNHTKVWSFNPCSSVFMAEKDYYKFNADTDIPNIRNIPLPVVLNWAIGNMTCEEAQKNLTSFACHKEHNSYCIDSENGRGYRCSCYKGYEGNPYISPGCQDANECEDETNNPCEGICTNLVGSYRCSCPKGSTGDGRKDGTGCSKKITTVIKIVIGVGLALLCLIIGGSLLFLNIKKRKLSKLRDEFFLQNGGMLLKQQIGSHAGAIESTQIFTAKELEIATNKYDESRILGRGGYGTVYKGILSDNRVVAIKKSQIIVQSQIEQFINEVVILTQVHHRNVVRLLGCCLETQVPLLVYEYVSNGTLFEHIHHKVAGLSSISWEGRLRIAAETAGALAYLHSAASIPVIHRDIKSTNILLDENFTAKVSDFRASRLVPLDRTQITTVVQGTVGYLDPEYFHTSQLTEKSDVYSFGVVLIELLTGEKPLSLERSQEQRNLTSYFILSLKDGGLFDLLDARVTKEGKQEQVVIAAELAKRCLNLRGQERPRMKEVAAELEGLRRMLKTHTGTDCPPNHKEEKTSLLEPQDLYTVPLSSDQYSFQKNTITGINIRC